MTGIEYHISFLDPEEDPCAVICHEWDSMTRTVQRLRRNGCRIVSIQTHETGKPPTVVTWEVIDQIL